MNRSLVFKAFSAGFAMFTMFFGAGNVIFPLMIGHYAADQQLPAMLGLMITAVLVPFAAVIAMILYEGDYEAFFNRLGRTPGFLLCAAILLLIGPFGAIPRCITISYASVKALFPSLSVVWFSIGTGVLLFLCTLRQNRVVSLLGPWMTPLLIGVLGLIIGMGLLTPAHSQTTELSAGTLFMHGLKEGYNTMDLLAAFFFSSSIFLFLRKQTETRKELMRTAWLASIIGAFLLGAVYFGFSLVASRQGALLSYHNGGELLLSLTSVVLGESAAFWVAFIITLACFTTAMALLVVFTEFVQTKCLKNRVRYEWLLLGGTLVACLISMLEFSGISAFLAPILQVCYPGLILFTFLNIAHKFFRFHPLKMRLFLFFSGLGIAFSM